MHHLPVNTNISCLPTKKLILTLKSRYRYYLTRSTGSLNLLKKHQKCTNLITHDENFNPLLSHNSSTKCGGREAGAYSKGAVIRRRRLLEGGAYSTWRVRRLFDGEGRALIQQSSGYYKEEKKRRCLIDIYCSFIQELLR